MQLHEADGWDFPAPAMWSLITRVVKNLKRIERLGFRSHNFLAPLLS